MSAEDDNGFSLFKWKGPLDARKIVERYLAAAFGGATAGAIFYGLGVLFG